MVYQNNNSSFKIIRYPKSSNKSLNPWSAADEYLLKYLDDINLNSKEIIIYNDRFGFLTCFLHSYSPTTILSYKSQEKACKINLKSNNLVISDEKFSSPLLRLFKKYDVVLIKIPKSIELFELYLNQISNNLADDSIVICGFMTRHFSTQMLSVAEKYFDEVTQSQAWKKSRLLFLKKNKKIKNEQIINTIKWDDEKKIKQYFGVFSSKNIDYATQFLLKHLKLREDENCILDLASGNGVIASYIQDKMPNSKLHLLDDSFLAIESSKLNLQNENTSFYFNDTLDDIEDSYFDLVVSNPPFHFEFENNIEISIGLFKEVKRCLKIDGRYVLVSSKHLNLKTHLIKIFSEVKIIKENKKFEIYECIR